jgi:cytochrome c-type biogenesis protein
VRELPRRAARMNETSSVGLAVAFGAGVLSFLSPCVLPLIPSYVTFITGMSLDEVAVSRRRALVHSLLFIAGFTIIFLALGASASALGKVIFHAREWMARIGGALIIVFGLYLLGAFDIAFFSRERRVHFADKPVGYFGTVLVGMAFGAGWTPCIGPILGSILIYTSSAADLNKGLALLFAYSMGLAVPFLIAALAVDKFIDLFAKYRGAMIWVNRASGVILIVIGGLLVTNYFTLIASYLQALTPDFIRTRI